MYYGDLASWYNNVEDGAMPEGGATYFDGYMQRYFHGWEDSGARTDSIWSGSRSTISAPLIARGNSRIPPGVS